MKTSEFIYCPICRHEIHPNKMKKVFIEKLDEICINPFTGGYLERYEYEKYKLKYILFKCPNDNTILNEFYLGQEEIEEET